MGHCCPARTGTASPAGSASTGPVQEGRIISTQTLSAPRAAATAAPDAAAVLAALAEPNRIRLLRLLLDGERCVTQCIERTALPQSLVSKHLRRLIDVGLVERRPAGRRNYHSVVDPDGLRELLDAAERLAGRPGR